MRYGFQTLQIQWFSQFGLPNDERLLPKALQEAGYRTALICKWQLGHGKKDLWPLRRGFDYFYGHLTGEIDYFRRSTAEITDWRRQDRLVEQGYAAHLGEDAVVGWPARSGETAVPQLAFAAPLAPLQAP
jgi:arylsulfatase A-like enzyme